MMFGVTGLEPGGWHSLAVCAVEVSDPNMFFPFGADIPYMSETVCREAKKLCASCPVKQECLEWALEHEEHGIWGGSTPGERRLLRQNGGR